MSLMTFVSYFETSVWSINNRNPFQNIVRFCLKILSETCDNVKYSV